MKNVLKKYWLHIFCVAVWMVVALLCILMIRKWDGPVKSQSAINVQAERVQVNNYYAPVTINNSFKLPEIRPLDFVSYVYEATRTWDKNDEFEYSDAINLCYLIDEIAKIQGLDRKQAYLIVHIESDYRADAVSNCGAVGLTQVMKECLNEYNNYHHRTFTMQDMLKPRYNLTVGFWYYKRILTHYDEHYHYITHTDYKTEVRDAYLAYNYGVTRFYQINREGRNELRRGRYPENIYGAKKGDVYSPIFRLNDISQYYF